MLSRFSGECLFEPEIRKMKIAAIHLKNFRLFQNVTIDNLPNCCVFVGANGTGKSSLFDLFGFLRDALTHKVNDALAKRGGFKEVVSRGTTGPIELVFQFQNLKATSFLVTYSLVIDLVKNKPVVKREVLKYLPEQDGGEVKHFLDFSQGLGKVHNKEENSHDAQEQSPEFKLDSPDILALKELEQLPQSEIAREVRRFIENWHISDFQLQEAIKNDKSVGYNEHLSSRGDNLALFAQRMYNHYPDEYHEILHQMARLLPGFAKLEPVTSAERILLTFHYSTFKEPFRSWQVSDGTINLLAYLLLLYDPNPHPLLCVGEPERQLYPHFLSEFAEDFRLYAGKDGQVCVSTQSPDFLNGVPLNEIFWLAKQNGYTQMHRATESQLLQDFIEGGDLPGALWKQRLLEDADLL